MKVFFPGFVAALLVCQPAFSLTLKTGEVLGGDGKVYSGASPQNSTNLVSQAKASGNPAGVANRNLFVVVDETITFVPVAEISGLEEEEVLDLVGDRVVQNVTGVETMTMETFNTASTLASETGLSLAELDGTMISGLDPQLAAQIRQASAISGISVENIIAVGSAMESLSEDRIAEVSDSISSMIEQGFGDSLEETLDQLGKIEGGLETALGYDSLEACQAGGGSNCEAVAALMEEGNPNN